MQNPPLGANIILTGFSYSGKSSVARILARRLGWAAIDTDELIVRKAGQPIPEIFAADGEAAFRRLEKEALREACSRTNAVIATGGGAVLDPENRRLMARSGVVILLETQPETIHRRLLEAERHKPSKEARPLLKGNDPLGNIRQLKAERQPSYAEAHWTVHTDAFPLEQVAEEALRGYRLVLQARGAEAQAAGDLAYTVTTETQSYPGYIGWGILDSLGPRMREAGLSGNACVIADGAVSTLYGPRVEASLRGAGFSVNLYQVPPGEASKTLASAADIYGWLAQRRAERGHCIISLGGGMVGDLAGFVASTYVRGMPLVHVPTSLLAMVDASIGGKVAVDLPVGKNLVGAFYQPRLVLTDVETLKSLPPRDLTCGWAEVIKHALILDATLFAFLRENCARLRALDPHLATEAVKRSAAIKARVVSEDEKETTGRRMLLNYGHTVGHALEAAAGYKGLLHGEAVTIGMMAAASIAQGMGLLEAEAVEEQHRMLESFGLPLSAHGVDREAVRRAMQLDKKVVGAAIQWVLLQRIGRATVRGNVPSKVVEEALHQVLRD